LQDREGTTWAGGLGGLWQLQNGRWQKWETSEMLSTQPVIDSLYEDRRGTLWVATSLGCFQRAHGQRTFQPVTSFPRVRAFSEDADGTLWVAGSEGSFDTLESSRPEAPRSRTWKFVDGWNLHTDRKGNLWVATRAQGLLRISKAGSPHRLTEASGLSSDTVRSILEDREGNIWVGTQNGLTRLREATVLSLSRAYGTEINKLVNSVTATRDHSVWVGTVDGIYRVHGGDLGKSPTRYGLEAGLPSPAVSALHADESDAVWVATSEGLALGRDGRFVRLALNSQIKFTRITAITVDQRGTLWICDFEKGLFRWSNGQLKPFVGPELAGKTVRAVYAAQNGDVWIGLTEGGVARYREGLLRSYSERDGLAADTVTAISGSERGAIWIATTDGLTRFVNDQFVTVTKSNGLPGNIIEAIVEQNGYVWLGASAGIVRLAVGDFEKAAQEPGYRLQYTLYDAADGLPGDPIGLGSPSVARTRDGRLWFLTTSGVALLDPERSERDRLPPLTRIETISADGNEIDRKREPKLPSRTSNILIEYTGLSLTAPEKLTFRYRLEGFDSDWINAGKRRQAFYTNLPPGGYRFHVASNNDGVWSETNAVLDFAVTPTFYQTRWFYLVGALLLSLLILAAWQIRVQQVRQQFVLVLAERSRMAREIHDTLLQSLVGIALQFDELASKVESSPRAAKEQLARLSRQVQLYVRETRQSIWALRSPTLEVCDLATSLRERAESIIGSRGLAFEFVVTGTPRRCSPDVIQELQRIGQEATSNAVRHGRPTLINMELSYANELVTLRVTDNGSGFDTQESVYRTTDHCGLDTMRERAHLVGGQCTIVSSPGRGTQVEVSVPLFPSA
jgi:signal transduction histidine kinase/streptogramin lyase